MKKFFDMIITFVLTILVISVLGITTYACLEFLEIIKVPEKYSIIKFIYSKIEVITSVTDYIEIAAEEKDLEEIWEKQNTIVVELEGNNVTKIQLREDGQEINLKTNFKYYDQLDKYARKIYDVLEKDKEMLKTGMHRFDFGTEFNDLLHEENGKVILNNAFQIAVNSFLYDHPEIFYIDITEMYLLTETIKTLISETHKVSIGPNENNYLFEDYRNIYDVNAAIKEVEQAKQEIKNNLTGTTYDKIKYVHDYLIENAEYERAEENQKNYNIYGILISKRAVCEGYAKAFKYILDDIGIPCAVVCGIARNSSGVTENHAWNYVLLKNRWYAVDVTWDDPIIIGHGYLTNESKYKYFLKGSNSFFTDHIEDTNIVEAGTIKYPVLNDIDYK